MGGFISVESCGERWLCDIVYLPHNRLNCETETILMSLSGPLARGICDSLNQILDYERKAAIESAPCAVPVFVIAELGGKFVSDLILCGAFGSSVKSCGLTDDPSGAIKFESYEAAKHIAASLSLNMAGDYCVETLDKAKRDRGKPREDIRRMYYRVALGDHCGIHDHAYHKHKGVRHQLLSIPDCKALKKDSAFCDCSFVSIGLMTESEAANDASPA